MLIMKIHPSGMLFAGALLGCGLLGCSEIYRPTGSGYNAQGHPRAVPADGYESDASLFTPGSYLQTLSPHTAFFLTFPRFEDRPYKILPDYTDVKVVSLKGTYVKVELVNTGEVGYVPSIMLGKKRSMSDLPAPPPANEAELEPQISPELIDPSRPAE